MFAKARPAIVVVGKSAIVIKYYIEEMLVNFCTDFKLQIKY